MRGTTRRVLTLHNTSGAFAVLRCDECGAEHSPAPDDAIDEKEVQKHFFDEDLYTIANLPAVHRMWRRQVREIERLHPANGRILDIGCNTGEFLFCAGAGWERHGIEIADVPASMAEAKGIHVYRKPLEECAFENDRFDVVTLFALIEHLTDPRSIVKEIARIVKPGGLVVIMTGDRASWKARLLGSHWHMYIPPLHRFFFHRASLRQVCREFGLSEVDYYYSHGGMTFASAKLLKLAEKATLWQLFDLPGLRHVPFYDHYYGYFVKK